MDERLSRTRAALLWLLTTVVTAGIELALWPLPFAASGRFDALLVALCSWILALAVAWLWVLLSLVVGAILRAPSGAAQVPGVPAWLRRLVLAACGVSLSAGLAAGPAGAAPDRIETAVPADHSGRVVRTASTTEAAHRASSGTPTPSPGPGSIRVRPGDTLWDLTAARLPARERDAAAVSHHWPLLYAYNRELIGPDPDRLEPGQQLRLPASLQSPR